MTGLAPHRKPRRLQATRRASACGLIVLVAMLVSLVLSSCGGGGGVSGSGTVEMNEIDVASMVGGRIVRLFVTEGDTVAIGDTLAILDRSELAADLQARAAQSAQAIAQHRDLQAGPRDQEVEAARATLEAATASEQLAKIELERIEKLHAQGLASDADLDRARNANTAAIAQRKAAAQNLELLEAGFRSGQIAAAGQAANAARAQLAASRSRFDELILLAPVRGVVLLENFRTGELAGAGIPVVTLGNPDSLWVRIYVAAPELEHVLLGMRAEVRVQGSQTTYPGRVVEIATRAEFTPRAALTEEERANLVFGVKIVIDPSGGRLKAGLPVHAVFRTETSP